MACGAAAGIAHGASVGNNMPNPLVWLSVAQLAASSAALKVHSVSRRSKSLIKSNRLPRCTIAITGGVPTNVFTGPIATAEFSAATVPNAGLAIFSHK